MNEEEKKKKKEQQEKEFYNRFFSTFKAGLYKEANGVYNIEQKDSGALGKYQFIPRYYLTQSPSSKEDKLQVPSIKAFALKEGYTTDEDITDDALKEVFLKNNILQEHYFEIYVKNLVYPKTVELYKKYHDRGLSFDQIGGFYHFEPKAAINYLKTGKHRPETKINPSSEVYLERYDEGLRRMRIDHISKEEAVSNYKIYNEEELKKHWEEFKIREKEIIDLTGISRNVKGLKLEDLRNEYHDQGFYGNNGTGIFNRFIDEENEPINKEISEDAIKLEKFLNNLDPIFGRDATGGFFDAITKPFIDFSKIFTEDSEQDKRNKEEYSSKYTSSLTYDENGVINGYIHEGNIPEEYRYIINKLGQNAKDGSKLKKFKKGFYTYKKDGIEFKVYNVQDVFREAQKMANKFTAPPEGKELILVNDDGTRGRDLSTLTDFTNYLNKGKKGSAKQLFLRERDGNGNPKNQGKISIVDRIDPNRIIPRTHFPNVLKPSVSAENKETASSNETGITNPTPKQIKEAEDKAKKDGYKTVVDVEKKKKEADDKASLDIFNSYWNLNGEEPNEPRYNPSEYKDNFPYSDLITSVAGIAQGQALAKEEIPLRDEEVSSTLRNYASELAKLSQIGLRPEEEAYSKRMLAESYQSSLDQIVRASNGNRNIVLGNLGRLDYQKQTGLLELSIADAKAKTDALAKYDEATKYISEFEANKSIANNEREYDNAITTREAGASLMQTGWKSLMDNIQYYKENKPGSATHMLKSFYSQKYFGVDPNKKDNGKGDIKGTISYQKRIDAENMKKYKKLEEAKQLTNLLNDTEKIDILNYAQENHLNSSQFADEIIGMTSEMGNNNNNPISMPETEINNNKESGININPNSISMPDFSIAPETSNNLENNQKTNNDNTFGFMGGYSTNIDLDDQDLYAKRKEELEFI